MWIVALALAAAVGLGACGQLAQPTSEENDGVYVEAGAVTYQLQVSRELNPFSVEDREYLRGLPARVATLSPDELWYGVFLWAKNQSSQPQTTAGNFSITDTNGDTFHPIPLDPAINGYVWTPIVLGPGGQQPVPNSTAWWGPTQGALILFKLPTTVYSNRPLTLQIVSPAGHRGNISLDL